MVDCEKTASGDSFSSAQIEQMKQMFKDKISVSEDKKKQIENSKREIFVQINKAKDEIRSALSQANQHNPQIIATINSIEYQLETTLLDMSSQVTGISKKLDELNGEFFSGVFKDVFTKEIDQREAKYEEYFEHKFDEIKKA